MKIAHVIQHLATDAVSTQTKEIDQACQRLGYESAIFTLKYDPHSEYPVQPLSNLQPDRDQVVIFHFSTGTSLVKWIFKYPYPIVLMYHNITPARFFFGNAWGSFNGSLKGRRQLQALQKKTLFAWGVSEYSRRELVKKGFTNTGVLPIFLDPAKYLRQPINQKLNNRYNDGYTNMLFVGRVWPHKKQVDLVKILAHYQRLNPKIRLILAGGGKKKYTDKLLALASRLGVQKDLILTGKISFQDLCTWYRVATLFLSMSEHEGFCIPIVEAMIFAKPVFAYAAAAVPETIADAGVLFPKKNFPVIAATIQQTLFSSGKLNELTKLEAERVETFSIANTEKILSQDLKQIKDLFVQT